MRCDLTGIVVMVTAHSTVGRVHHHSVLLEEGGPGTVVVTPVVHESLKICAKIKIRVDN